jgi:alkylation response protein AidB-like acyl-CoA dehydrogenase
MLFHHIRERVEFPPEWLNVWEQVQPLCQRLESMAEEVDRQQAWPKQSLREMAEAGVFRWFIPRRYEGWEWDSQQQLAGYLALCQSCMTTTFILTQWQAAVRRILTSQPGPKLGEGDFRADGSGNGDPQWVADLAGKILPPLARGEAFATVGISHLSTSRQHLGRPILVATPTDDGYRLSGSSPWITGAMAADWMVIGATLADGNQLLLLVDGRAAGVTRHSGMPLMALSGSCTDKVELDNVLVPASQRLAGPVMNVMAANRGSGGGTGGLHTSTLAVGLAMRALEFLFEQSLQRNELGAIAEQFLLGLRPLLNDLRLATAGDVTIDLVELRQRANSLVLRSTQAALQAAKGAGFVSGHPAGRWAREGLFFLVWSCPPAVIEENLCELAGLRPGK